MRATCRYLAAIETSCDETSFSVLECDFPTGQARSATAAAQPKSSDVVSALPQRVRVLAHLVHSQGALHDPFGGVVPEVAARDHLAHLPALARKGLQQAGIKASECGALAVTAGPGLIGAVMVGYLFAQGFAEGHGVPLIAVNHVDAHLAPASLLSSFDPVADVGQWLELHRPRFPRLALTVSGGHCLLTFWPDLARQVLLGTTLDDACGEAFDKVAKLLGLGYPGGPRVEDCARRGRPERFAFSRPLTVGSARTRRHSICPLPFSFSGLKTAALRTAQACQRPDGSLNDTDVNDIAAGFQQAALEHLADRLEQAVAFCAVHPELGVIHEVVVAGGVAANASFRLRLEALFGDQLRVAPPALCGDNATMIALQALLGGQDGRKTSPFSRYTLASAAPSVAP